MVLLAWISKQALCLFNLQNIGRRSSPTSLHLDETFDIKFDGLNPHYAQSITWGDK